MGDMKKPLPVKIVEAIAWTYVVLSVLSFIWAIVNACRSGGESLFDILLVSLFGLCLMSLTVGMVFSLRRGRRAWFLVPNTAVTLFCLVASVAVLCESMSADALSLGLVAWMFLVVPVVSLYLPASARWFKVKAENGRPDSLGCLGVFLLLSLFFVFVVVIPDIVICSRCGVSTARSQMMARCGQDSYALMVKDKLNHESGGDWIDPSSCTNSTQLINALWANLGEGKGPCPYADEWCIAVNPPDDDMFPVMVTANIDPRELLCPKAEDRPLKLTCPKEWGGNCFKYCEKMGVVVRKGGAALVLKSKYVRPKLVFRDGIPRPRADTYFLTPTGRVDIVKEQGLVK